MRLLPDIVMAIGMAVVLLLIGFVAGYEQHASQVRAEAAQQTAIQQTTTAAIATTDNATAAQLGQQIDVITKQATHIQSLIVENRHANPAPVSSDCRLPVGLRDALDAELAPDPR